MTSLSEQVAYLRLSPLTPIHVGTGDTLDPLAYIMRKEDGTPFLYPVDLSAWVEAYDNPAELAQFFSSRELPEIRRRIARELDPHIFGGAPARIHSTEIFEKYEKELGAKDSRNQLLIDPAVANGRTGALIIPGSSIKGAIRTAVIDWVDKNSSMDLKGASDSEWDGQKGAYSRKLKEYLGEISDNAFKDLKVGDFQAPLGDSMFVTAREVRWRPSNKPPTPKHDCQVTLSLAMSGKPYSLYGKVTIGGHGAQRRDTFLTVGRSGALKQSWSLNELMVLCRSFYWSRYLQEKQKFYTQPHLTATAKALAPVDAAIVEESGTGMLLRIGHYSHVECMTISKHSPKTRKAKDGTLLPYGTTRTLASGLFPFGWAVLEECSATEYREAEARRESHDAILLRERRDRRRAILDLRAENERIGRAKEIREEEDRMRREHERALLESMSPLEQLVFRAKNGTANENQMVELFGNLAELGATVRGQAASCLKEYWIANKKWTKKECSKKQWEKVTSLKQILGES